MSIPKNSSERILQNTPLIDQIIPDVISNYKFDDKLGEGRFGKVRLAIHKLTKEKVAIKIIDKNQIKLKEHRQRVDSEISILKQVNHYNTCKLYSIIENEERIYLIQEYISGNDLSLFIKQKDKPHIKEQNACKYFRQIISGIEYLHKLNIAHRDLKPENILINQKNDIKLIDFGLGKIFNKGELLKTQCGSPFYASPEMIKGNKYNGISSDIWSLGVILFSMLFEELPFMEADVKRLYKKILEGKYEIPKDKINIVSKEAIDLVKKILEVDPKKRIKISGIKNHPWFNKESNPLHQGIYIKEIVMPIDEEIVEEITNKFGYEKMRIRNTILRNLYNNIRSLYCILLEKKIKSNKKSVADLSSDLYMQYINDEKNKLTNYENNIENALKQRMNSKEQLNILPDYEENKEFLNEINENSDIERRDKKGKTQVLKLNSILSFSNNIKSNKDNTLNKRKNKKPRNKQLSQFEKENENNNSQAESLARTKTNDLSSTKRYRKIISQNVKMNFEESAQSKDNELGEKKLDSATLREKLLQNKLNFSINKKMPILSDILKSEKIIIDNNYKNSNIINNMKITRSVTNDKNINVNSIIVKKNKNIIMTNSETPIQKDMSKKKIKNILYKINDNKKKFSSTNKFINKNNLFSDNRNLLVNINSKKINNEQIKNINNNNIIVNHKSFLSPGINQSIEFSKLKNKKELSIIENSSILKNFYTNKKINNSLINKNSEFKSKSKSKEKIKLKPGKTYSNFYINKSETKNIIVNASSKKSIKNNNKIWKKTENEFSSISSNKKRKKNKNINLKTNSSLLHRKQRNRLNLNQNGFILMDTDKTERVSNIHLKPNISNNEINKINNIINVSMNNFQNPNLNGNNFFNNNSKSIQINKKDLVLNNVTSLGSKSQGKIIMVNLMKKENKNKKNLNNKNNIILPKNQKLTHNNVTEAKTKNNEKSNNLENQIIFNEKNIISYEQPFDLSFLYIYDNNQNIKGNFEKYLKTKKIDFAQIKDRVNNNNKKQINLICNKKNGLKFNISLSNIKNEYNNEDNNLYVLKIKTLCDNKYNFINLFNSFNAYNPK